MTRSTADDDKCAKREPKGDYAIGYARPPEHTRFKPGNQAAAKKGRPKGRKSTATIISGILESKVEVMLPSGLRKKIPMLEALMRKQTFKAAQEGDTRAFMALLGLAREAGLIGPTEPPTAPEAPLTPIEQQVADDLFLLLGASRGIDPQRLEALSHTPPPRPSVRRVDFGNINLAAALADEAKRYSVQREYSG